MNLKDLASKFISNLVHIYDSDEALAIFLIAIDKIMGYRKNDFLLRKAELLDQQQLTDFDRILVELARGKPIQYILGETYFYGLTLKVDSSVLIPRPETEELVDWILSICNTQSKTAEFEVNLTSKFVNILDIGTGSGCIAIALKKNLSFANVQALDISKDSLAIAAENATINGVNVGFVADDILNPKVKYTPKYSVIVSNPPYITALEKLAMHRNVWENEPHHALFVSNEKPLIFYEAIAEFAMLYLVDNGLLFFEINEYLGKQTLDMLAGKGFKDIKLKNDMQGKDRMICCSWVG